MREVRGQDGVEEKVQMIKDAIYSAKFRKNGKVSKNGKASEKEMRGRVEEAVEVTTIVESAAVGARRPRRTTAKYGNKPEYRANFCGGLENWEEDDEDGEGRQRAVAGSAPVPCFGFEACNKRSAGEHSR